MGMFSALCHIKHMFRRKTYTYQAAIVYDIFSFYAKIMHFILPSWMRSDCFLFCVRSHLIFIKALSFSGCYIYVWCAWKISEYGILMGLASSIKELLSKNAHNAYTKLILIIVCCVWIIKDFLRLIRQENLTTIRRIYDDSDTMYNTQ